MINFGKLYLSNKMTGIPYFNAPWFDLVATQLRNMNEVAGVFNPADEDRKVGFDPMTCPKGELEEAIANGFNARRALGADWSWIAANADALVVGPDWPISVGAISEIACAQALRLPVWEYSVFIRFITTFNPQGLLEVSTQLPQFRELIGVTTG